MRCLAIQRNCRILTRWAESLQWYASCFLQETIRHQQPTQQSLQRKWKDHIMLWAIFIAGTYVAGIYLIRLVWWQE